MKLRYTIWRLNRYKCTHLNSLGAVSVGKRYARRGLSGFLAVTIVLSVLPAFLIVPLFTSHAQAATASQGPRSATAYGDCVEDASAGTAIWTSPGDAYKSDATYASVSVDGTTSRYIKCTNFGFSMPTGVTISGIVLTLTRKSSSTGNGGSQDAAIRLVKGGVIGTTDRSTTTIYTTADVSEAHGTSSDLWGTTWAASDINASNFGAEIAVTKANAAGSAHTVTVDVATITVTYSFNPTFNQSSYRWFNNQDANQLTFAKLLGGSGNEQGQAVVQTSDGGYAETGETASYGTGGLNDMYLAKYDSLGTLSWSRTWGSSGTDMGQAVVQTSDGGYAVAGYTNALGAGSDDVFLVKYDSSGTLSWSKTWGGSGSDQANSLVQTSDGGFAITGYTNVTANGEDVFVLKINSTGSTITFQKTWGGTGNDRGTSLIQTSDGGFAVTGYTDNSVNGKANDMFLIKLDSTGSTITFQKTWGGTSSELGYSLVQTSDGGYAVTGDTLGYGAGGYDMFLAKYDSTGTLSWSKTWGGTGVEHASSLVQTSDGGYAVTGYTQSFNDTTYGDMFLAKYDSTGTLSWSTTWGGTSIERSGTVVQTSDGGYAVTGYTQSYGAGSADALLLKYSSTGTIYNCSSTVCRTPTVTVGAPTASVGTLAYSLATPAYALGTPAALTDSPTPITTELTGVSGIDVGTALAAQNTAATGLAEQSIFRLRLDLHVGTDPALGGSYFNFKLQYAARGADNLCDTSFTNESYADVTSSTPIAYGDNSVAADGRLLATNANDPTHSTDTLVRQEYNEANNTSVVNNVAAGQDGMWDFALKDNGAPASTPYCFRLVTDTGSTLGGYTVIPQITTVPPNFSQANYRWYKGQDATPNNTFVQTWGSSSTDQGLSVVQTTDGGYAVAGYTNAFGSGGDDAFLAKYDSSGTLSWSRTWGGINTERAQSVIQTSDGGYAMTGQTSSYNDTLYGEAFLVKYDSSGTLLWSRTWGKTTLNDIAYDVLQTTDGGYVITGNTGSFGAGDNDIFLAKFDSSGTLSWSRTWGGTGNEYSRSLVQTTDGGYAVAGYTSTLGGGGGNDLLLVKFDSSGTVSWSRTWGGTGSDQGNTLVQTADGGYAVAGSTASFSLGSLLVKYDSSGALQWSRTSMGSGDSASSLVQTVDGGYAVAGQTSGYSVGSYDTYLAKYSSSGVLNWSKTWGGASSDSGSAVVQTSDGGYAVTGSTSSYGGGGGGEMFLAKFDSIGTVLACPSTMCTAPAPGDSSVSGTSGSPSLSTNSVSATVTTPSPGTSSPTATVTAIAGYLTFAKTLFINTTNNGHGEAVVQTTDGGYAVVGYVGISGGDDDAYIAKYDSTGALSWITRWGDNSTGREDAYAIVQTSDGGYAITGTTTSYATAGGYDLFLAKFTSTGSLSWNKTWGTTGNDEGHSIVQISDGSYVVGGWSSANLDAMLIKFSSTGTVIWSSFWGGAGSEYENSMIQTSDGGFVVTGITNTYGTSGEMFLVKYNSSGSVVWSNLWGGSGNDEGGAVVQTSDGGYAVAGTTHSYGDTTNGDAFLAKYDSTGTLSWSKTWGGTSAEHGNSLVQTSDGGYAVAGTTWSFGAGSSDTFLAKYDSTGTLSWSKTWGGASADQGYSLVQTSDGGYAVAGDTPDASNGGYGAALLAKYDSTGTISGCPSTMCKNITTATITSPTAGTSPITSAPTPPTVTSASPTAGSGTLTPVGDTFQVTRAIWGSSDPIPGPYLGAQDTAASSVRHDDPLRLRLNLISVKSVLPASVAMKIQVAPKVGAACGDDETFVDLGSSAPFNYYNNPNLADGAFPALHPNEIVPSSGTLYRDTYSESNSTLTNRRSYANGQNSLWDISVSPTDNVVYNAYCFRVLKSDNSALTSYSVYPEITIPPAASQQMRHGKFFSEITTSGTGSSKQPFYW